MIKMQHIFIFFLLFSCQAENDMIYKENFIIGKWRLGNSQKTGLTIFTVDGKVYQTGDIEFHTINYRFQKNKIINYDSAGFIGDDTILYLSPDTMIVDNLLWKHTKRVYIKVK